MSPDDSQHVPLSKRTALYPAPGTDAVTVRQDLEYLRAESGSGTMDVYSPSDPPSGARLPAVLIVAGYPDPGFERTLGCASKEMGSTVSWARLIAASGMVAVAYANREPVADGHAVLAHLRGNADTLGIDASRIGLWACSGNVPLALSLLMQDQADPVACAALLYGYTLDLGGSTLVADAARIWGFANPEADRLVADIPQNTPLFVARAGRDECPGLNQTLDRFATEALARNLPVTVVNYPDAPHAFDLILDSPTTRETIRQVLAFLRFYLRSLAPTA